MMGGDRSLCETVQGICMAAGLGFELVPVGDRELLWAAAESLSLDLSPFRLVHAPDVITMEDGHRSVLRGKSDSSMSLALRLLSEGEGDAMVSAGNTGALFTGACLTVGRLGAVRRPAIAALLPLRRPVLLLDAGANVSVTPDCLVQFAVMGTVYMKRTLGVACPTVGLLNVGAEAHKGTSLQVDTHKLLLADSRISFVGNVEADRAAEGACDVLVADGFSGNLLLKAMEGMGRLMLHTVKDIFASRPAGRLAALAVRSDLRRMKRRFDPREVGGAPILGLSRPVIKAHGSSDARAFANAIRQASVCAEQDLSGELTAALGRSPD